MKCLNFIFLTSLIMMASCASRPVLYPNARFQQVGEEVAQQDIDRCMQEGESYLAKYNSKTKKVATGAAKGAIAGTVMGGVSGLLFGNAGRSIVGGAAIGAAGGATGAALSPDEIKRSYVQQCLRDKGYQVIGWD